MPLSSLRTQDWEHRLGVLSAWRYVLSLPLQDACRCAVYGAVLDGCAITIRALCDLFEIRYDFKDFEGKLIWAPNRIVALEQCLKKPTKKKHFHSAHSLTGEVEEQRCLLEVLFLANRAVAHPSDGMNLDHEVRGGIEMPTAINLILRTLIARLGQLPALEPVTNNQPELFKPLPIEPVPLAAPMNAAP